MELAIGAVDHIDQQDRPIAETFDSRLKLIQAYDRAGFYAFHVTEHHFTPLGLSPSPNVFLAAASRITERLRFATLVYVMTAYHPLRLAEEICMMDHLTHGRFEIGLGRGISPFEIGYLNIDHLQSRAIFREAWEVVRAALTQDSVTFEGKYFQCRDVPIVLKPYQLPHPPLWQAPSGAEAVAQAARIGMNLAFNRPANVTKPMTDLYRKVWSETPGTGGRTLPKLAVGAHLYLDHNAQRAKERAEFGYAGWYKSFAHLWRKFVPMVPPQDQGGAGGRQRLVISGTPAQVREQIEQLCYDCGANYFLARFAYGDLPYEESAASLRLFVDEVMPHFRAETEARAAG